MRTNPIHCDTSPFSASPFGGNGISDNSWPTLATLNNKNAQTESNVFKDSSASDRVHLELVASAPIRPPRKANVSDRAIESLVENRFQFGSIPRREGVRSKSQKPTFAAMIWQ